MKVTNNTLSEIEKLVENREKFAWCKNIAFKAILQSKEEQNAYVLLLYKHYVKEDKIFVKKVKQDFNIDINCIEFYKVCYTCYFGKKKQTFYEHFLFSSTVKIKENREKILHNFFVNSKTSNSKIKIKEEIYQNFKRKPFEEETFYYEFVR